MKRKQRHTRHWIISLVLVSLCEFCAAQSITVAAAADLQFAMQEIVAGFQKQTGKQVKVIYGSSGNFFQQIQNGAPFDIFFSANIDYPKQLESSGLTAPGSYYQYAKGNIVVWVSNDSKINISSGLKSFLDPAVKKIAIANPQHAPYGQAAVAAMQSEGVYDKVKDKIVTGESISQTASYVVSGAADAGVIALSLALSPNMKDKGHYVKIPSAEYLPIRQACVILNSSKEKETAHQFLSYIKSKAAAETLQRYGFGLPANSEHNP